MKWFKNLSFVARIGLAMVLALALNVTWGYFLKEQLSQKEYLLRVEVDYNISSTMEMHFDTGRDFNRVQEVVQVVRSGESVIQFPFKVEDEGQLKFLRLDFGNETGLSEVRLKRLSLHSGTKLLFALNEKEIAKHTGLLNGMEKLSSESGDYSIAVAERPFDPYVVFSPVNELIYPLWQRTLLLLAPWILFLIIPVLNWVKERFEKKEVALFLTALFLCSIPLKIAWVTFTALLLLAYSLFEFFKTRRTNISSGRLAILGLFLVPLIFLGQGQFSELAIPLGFVIFPIVFSIRDFSTDYDNFKEIYTKVFFVVTSITIVSWLLLMGYEGYFYRVSFSNYFTDIKSNVHWVMEWLFYSHPSFLSFFILIGGICCLDLFKRQKVSKVYAITYACLVVMALPILGSRFAWVLALLLPALYFIPVQHLKRILLPLWLALFAGTIYFIDKLDLLRAELWKISIEKIKQNLWFGLGTGTSADILPTELAIEKKGAEALIGINHSHNQFLTYLLENGILGTVLFTVLMLFVFYQYAKQNNKMMLLIVFCVLFLMVVESPFMTATPLYVVSFLLSCFLSFPKKQA